MEKSSNPSTNASHFISLETAVDMTTRHRTERENILANIYQGQNVLPICETFNRDAFDALLSKPDCFAVRLYYGMDSTKKVHAIFVAVNSKNEDMLPGKGAGINTDEVIIEEAQRCPDLCPSPSPLNI